MRGREREREIERESTNVRALQMVKSRRVQPIRQNIRTQAFHKVYWASVTTEKNRLPIDGRAGLSEASPRDCFSSQKCMIFRKFRREVFVGKEIQRAQLKALFCFNFGHSMCHNLYP